MNYDSVASSPVGHGIQYYKKITLTKHNDEI